MKIKCLLICVLMSLKILGQDTVLLRLDASSNKILIKWYTTDLINADGYNVYRQSNSSDWTRINDSPIKPFEYQIPPEVMSNDKDLKSYLDIAHQKTGLKGLPLLAVLIKSFNSHHFSKHIGIVTEEDLQKTVKKTKYKVTKLNGSTETPVGISCLVSELRPATECPQKLRSEVYKSSVKFWWQPETKRYYGVNIYRRVKGETEMMKLNKEPIMLSQTDPKSETSNKFNFIDKDVKPKQTQEYFFESIDFFGFKSDLSSPLLVYINDHEAPNAPDSVFCIVKGRKIEFNWVLKNPSSDLIGFNVYRTRNSDTDFIKINKKIISNEKRMWSDSVQNFTSYSYKISSVDSSGNEKACEVHMVDVFDSEAPSVPTNIRIRSDSAKIILTWNVNKEKDLQGYLIYRTIDADNADAFTKLTAIPLTTNEFTDHLPGNAKNRFMYKLVAVDSSLNRSAYSVPVSARMPDKFAPSAPFLLSCDLLEDNKIKIKWLANTEPDLLGYDVYKSEYNSPSSLKTQVNNKIISAKLNEFIDEKTEEGTYSYFLMAKDSNNNISIPSNIINVKIKGTNPQLKNKLTLRCSYDLKKGKVQILWNCKTSEELVGYVVYKKQKGEMNFFPISGTLQDKNFNDENVTEGICLYQVRAYSKSGNRICSESEEINIETKNN